MKKSIVFLFVMCLISTLTFAQEANESANSHAPYMEFDKVVHDYGKIMENSDGECVFTVTNTGKEPLILTNAKSSCGCTVPSWSRTPILPGKSSEIKVKYSTKRIGQINKTITITSNASNSPVVLRIKGEVLKQTAESAIEKNIDASASPVAAPNQQ